MKNNLTFTALFFLLIFTFGACTEDGDIVNPTIELSSPNDGDSFSISDEIELVGRATDDISLKSVIITSSLGIDETISEFTDPTDFPFVFTLTLDPLTETGDYDIVLKAIDDSDNEAETSVNITVQ